MSYKEEIKNENRQGIANTPCPVSWWWEQWESSGLTSDSILHNGMLLNIREVVC